MLRPFFLQLSDCLALGAGPPAGAFGLCFLGRLGCRLRSWFGRSLFGHGGFGLWLGLWFRRRRLGHRFWFGFNDRLSFWRRLGLGRFTGVILTAGVSGHICVLFPGT